MASYQVEIRTAASPEAVWSAARDIGALHTRLVPGFVVDTRLEPGARIVTFGSGRVVREPIVSINDEARRLAWAIEAEGVRHYNASLQVFAREDGGAKVVWIADFLPDAIAPVIEAAMQAGAAAMQAAMDGPEK